MDLAVRDVVDLALRNSRTLANERLRRSVERFALKIAETEFQPRVTAGAYADRHLTDATVETAGVETALRLRVPTGGEFDLSSRLAYTDDGPPALGPRVGAVDLTFTQPLLRGGGTGVGGAALRTARLAEEINVHAFRAAIIDLVTNAVRAYRAYGRARQRTVIAERSLDRALALLEVNRLLVETGRMAERDIVQTQADIARRQLDLVASRGRLDAARLALIDILDIDAGVRFGSLAEFDPDAVAPASTDSREAIRIAFQHRPDYLATLLGLRNAETRALVARNDRLWDLSLTLGASLTGVGDSFEAAWRELDRADRRATLDLTIPVGRPAAGPAELAHRRATADLAIAKNHLVELEQRIVIDVTNSIRDVSLARQRVDLARESRRLTQEKAEIEREKLNLGVSTNFQLVAFENDLVLAEIDELDATVAYLNAVTEMDRTLGTTLDRWGLQVDRLEQGSATSP
ncbi:MAG: TolC family protein [Acidobacteria bacterium]|nr:TolC family protein [Acidobacteriota bacterium]